MVILWKKGGEGPQLDPRHCGLFRYSVLELIAGVGGRLWFVVVFCLVFCMLATCAHCGLTHLRKRKVGREVTCSSVPSLPLLIHPLLVFCSYHVLCCWFGYLSYPTVDKQNLLFQGIKDSLLLVAGDESAWRSVAQTRAVLREGFCG